VKIPIPVLYEDEHFLVFNKPAGLLVIPTAKNEQNTLVNRVNDQYACNEPSWRLHLCHRLDRDTSGAIILAKGKRNQQRMMELFQRRLVKKTYVVFVQGRLKHKKSELRAPVLDQEEKRFRRRAPAQLI
jgi:23S rRNA pseudouridine1911/1915/1917 synthase